MTLRISLLANSADDLAAFLIVLIVLVGVWIPPASAQDNLTDPEVTNNNFVVYENPTEGIGKIQYLGNWSVSERYGNGTTNILLVSPPESDSDQFSDGLTITIDVLPMVINGTTQQERIASQLDQIMMETNAEIQVVEASWGTTTITSAKHPAFRTVFTSTQKFITDGSQGISPVELHLKGMAISFIEHGQVLYSLIYLAEESEYPAYLPTIQEMIDSFETTDSKPIVTATTPATTSPSQCLIATAAFGSELTPQVQFLRNFRDNHILSTASGSSFMNVFNAWYYSFSPYVADYEREQPWLQQTVKAAIYPLLGILGISEKAYFAVPGNYGALLAGLISSAMIGAVYFSPMALASKQVRRNAFSYKMTIMCLGSVALVLGIMTMVSTDAAILGVSSAGFVLTTLATGTLLAARMTMTCTRLLNRLRK